jgi:hypothetical protein
MIRGRVSTKSSSSSPDGQWTEALQETAEERHRDQSVTAPDRRITALHKSKRFLISDF